MSNCSWVSGAFLLSGFFTAGFTLTLPLRYIFSLPGSLLILSSRFRVVELAHDFKLRVELLADVRLEVLLLLGKLGLRDNLLLHFPLLERAHLGLLVLADIAGHSLQLFLCQFFCILLLLLFSSFFVHRLLDLFPNSALEVLERLACFLNFPGFAFFDERIG